VETILSGAVSEEPPIQSMHPDSRQKFSPARRNPAEILTGRRISDAVQRVREFIARFL